MPRNHILWLSTHIKAILMKIINSEKSGPAKTGLAGLVATALYGHWQLEKYINVITLTSKAIHCGTKYNHLHGTDNNKLSYT